MYAEVVCLHPWVMQLSLYAFGVGPSTWIILNASRVPTSPPETSVAVLCVCHLRESEKQWDIASENQKDSGNYLQIEVAQMDTARINCTEVASRKENSGKYAHRQVTDSQTVTYNRHTVIYNYPEVAHFRRYLKATSE